MNSEYVNLTALGKRYGAVPRDVGLWLKEIGLREQDSRPSQRAIKDGFVTERVTEYGSQWLWNLEKTKDAIDGRRPTDTEEHDGFVLIRGT
jgi:hypothetical protein